jgi:uncharacterized membrane protein (DUF4010 family)
VTYFLSQVSSQPGLLDLPMSSASLEPAYALMLATGIGLLVGLERGWRQRKEHEGGRVAGIRTHALLGLGGGLVGLASTALSPWFGLVGLAGLLVALMLSYRARLAEPDDNVSATSAVVGVLTVLFGVLATIGFAREALVAGGATTLILSMRERLHGWLQTLGEEDIAAAAQFGAIALVILPLLPDRPLGPYDALNPRMLWLVVVFVTGLSFAGYWASKRFGSTRGTILAAAIGATYSSTAVTAELSRRLRAPEEDRRVLNAAIAAASAMMPLRVLILCGALMPSALGVFAIGVGSAAAFGAVYALASVYRADRGQGGGVAVRRNPFDFWPAVGFAVMVAVIIIAARWTIERYGAEGMTVLVGLTGLYDVDAAIIMTSTLPKGALPLSQLGILLSLPILVNTLLKWLLVLALGGIRAGFVAALPLLGGAALIASGIWVLSGN